MDTEASSNRHADNRGAKHNWSAEEDAALVCCLVTLKVEQRWMQGSNFESGYLPELEKMMEAKLLGCGLKGIPHIQSRIKTLKASWSTVNDMVYGTNTSGFGFDEDRQCVTADRDVWDEYIKSHPDAARFRYKPFPHLIDLTKVWGKDRATGGESRDVDELNDQADAEDGLEGINNIGQTQTPFIQGDEHSSNEMAQTLQTEGESASTSRKRKRRSTDDDVIESFKEIIAPLLICLDKIASKMDRIDRESALDEKRLALCEELSKVDGLTTDELVRAHLRLSSDSALLVSFFSLADHFKLPWLRQII